MGRDATAVERTGTARAVRGLAALGASGSVVALLVASALPAAAASHRTEVKLHRTGLGEVLVNPSGRTLYHITTEDHGGIHCTGTCAQLWPPFLVDKGTKLVRGHGMHGHLGTISRGSDKKVQVTYNKLPLYTYSGDSKAGQTHGQGFAKLWYVVKTNTSAKHPGTPSSSSSKSSGSSKSNSGGYSY